MNNVNIEPIFSLKYIIRYFINIVIYLFLNVRNSIMFFLFNVFLIALLLYSQNNDISLSIFKKTLLKVLTIIRF